jgi:hypothetical protein
MAEEPTQTPGGEGPTDLNTQLAALVRQAVLEALAAGPVLPAPAEGPALLLTTTPKLGLKLPALDDPALITDINDNMVILDDSVTATQAVTLTNKTLDAPIINNPTITGWTNAQHTHLNAAGAGPLDGAAIVSGTIGTGYLLRESGPALTDPLVRDTISWGAEPSGAADTTLQRAAPGRLRLVGSGTGASAVAMYEARFGGTGAPSTTVARLGQPAVDGIWMSFNATFDGTAWHPDDVTKAARHFVLGLTDFQWYDAVGADPLVWRQRMALDGNGTLTVTPLGGQPGLTVGPGGQGYIGVGQADMVGWNGAITAIGLGGLGSFFANTVAPGVDPSGSATAMMHNGKYVGGGIAASGTGRVALLQIGQNGLLRYYNSASTTAGVLASLVERLNVNGSGTLTLTPDAGQAALVARSTAGLLLQDDAPTHSWIWAPINTGTTLRLRYDATDRLTIGPTGTLTLTPDAATVALSAAGNGVQTDRVTATGSLRLAAGAAGAVYVNCPNGYFHPEVDNANYVGAPGARWIAVYAVNGTIQTSDPAQKVGAAPVDPAAALADVLGAAIIEYDLPAPTADDPEATMHHVGFDGQAAAPRLRVTRTAGGETVTSAEVEPNTTGSMALGAIQGLHGLLTSLGEQVAALTARVALLEGAAP